MPAERAELTGLTSAEVRDRIERDLVNRLPSRSGRSTADIVEGLERLTRFMKHRVR